MKRAVLFIPALMLLLGSCHGKEFLLKENAIRLTPAEMLYFVAGIRPSATLEFTYERHLVYGFSPQLVVGYSLPVDFNFKHDAKGIKIGLELKKYFKPDRRRFYVSTEAFYNRFSYFKTARVFDPVAFIYVSDQEETVRVRGNNYVYHGKFGVSFIKRGLSIDLFLGIGARYRSIAHSFDPNDVFSEGVFLNLVEDYFFGSGIGWQWSAVSGIRLGIPF